MHICFADDAAAISILLVLKCILVKSSHVP